jgi:hypothetical protein
MGTVSTSDGPEQPGASANTRATGDSRNPETQSVDQNSKIHGVLGDPGQKLPVPRTQFQRDLEKVEDGVTKLRRAGSILQAITENEGVQEIGKAIFKGVPALMKILETMSKAHPFAQREQSFLSSRFTQFPIIFQVAFEPFKWAYNQELKRRENETYCHFTYRRTWIYSNSLRRTSRLALFESIKNVMLISVQYVVFPGAVPCLI